MTAGKGRRGPFLLCGLSAMGILAGCQNTPYEAPAFSFLPSYRTVDSGVPVLLDNAAWWQRFDDRTLDDLIEIGLSGSLDLEIAKERVNEARAVRRAVPLSAFLTPGSRLQREGSDNGPDRTRVEASLGFDWIVDIYGQRRADVAAAGARVEVAEAEVAAARLLLLQNIANAYVDLRHWQRILELRRSELRSRRTTLDLITRLYEANGATRIDVVRAEALVSETRTQIPEIEAAIAAVKNEIAVLLGVTPGTLTVDLESGARQPRVTLSPEVGIPADLLRNRPDIHVAEREYYAAIRDVDSARADLYPRLSLSGTIALASLSGNLGADYFLGPALNFAIVPSTELRARVGIRESRVRQAHTTWRLRVLSAIRDVESALADYAASIEAQRSAANTVQLYNNVVELTRQIVTRDGATIRDLIEAEQDVADANTALADNLRRLGRSFVALNVSLGSGNDYGAAREEEAG